MVSHSGHLPDQKLEGVADDCIVSPKMVSGTGLVCRARFPDWFPWFAWFRSW